MDRSGSSIKGVLKRRAEDQSHDDADDVRQGNRSVVGIGPVGARVMRSNDHPLCPETMLSMVLSQRARSVAWK
ncbi:hypothetical protein Misp02_04790 [Microtetraspora sp. NBRC 16547]|nr:hypothetical protein Misp02_04790 [Microtetraspora sp. NBRC 16547]